MFLKNAWYVAAWASDIGENLVPLEILGERVVLYRTSAGACVALADACPHRKVPLSMGRLVNDAVECGYHGLAFDCSGACVSAPFSHAIPANAAVRAYPTVERYDLVWIWMGDPALADPDKVFRIDDWGKPGWGINRGESMVVECNYLYLVDNLLDPTHVTWVHPSSFGESSCAKVPVETVSDADGVTARRWLRDVEPAPFYKKHLKFDGRCDRYQHYEMRYPCNAIIRAVFVPAGHGGDGKPLHEAAFVMDSFNFIVPIDAVRTRYFWFQVRNFAPDDKGVSQSFAEDVRFAFSEDKRILEAVQIGMNAATTPHIDLKSDLSSFRFRKNMAKLIHEENP